MGEGLGVSVISVFSTVGMSVVIGLLTGELAGVIAGVCVSVGWHPTRINAPAISQKKAKAHFQVNVFILPPLEEFALEIGEPAFGIFIIQMADQFLIYQFQIGFF